MCWFNTKIDTVRRDGWKFLMASVYGLSPPLPSRQTPFQSEGAVQVLSPPALCVLQSTASLASIIPLSNFVGSTVESSRKVPLEYVVGVWRRLVDLDNAAKAEKSGQVHR